jgi:hypothetical protein
MSQSCNLVGIRRSANQENKDHNNEQKHGHSDRTVLNVTQLQEKEKIQHNF